jgi:hypothetical protein
MRRAAMQTAASAEAAKNALLVRATTIGVVVKACQAYANSPPAASGRWILRPPCSQSRPAGVPDRTEYIPSFAWCQATDRLPRSSVGKLLRHELAPLAVSDH